MLVVLSDPSDPLASFWCEDSDWLRSQPRDLGKDGDWWRRGVTSASIKKQRFELLRRKAPWGSPQVLKVNNRRMPSATRTSNESRRHSHYDKWTLFILIVRQELWVKKKWQLFVNEFLSKCELNTGYFFNNNNNKLFVCVHFFCHVVLARCRRSKICCFSASPFGG